MSADNFWLIRRTNNGKFATIMAFASDFEDDTDENYPTVENPHKTFDTVDDAVMWTLSDDAPWTEYGVVIHPECA